MIMHHRDPGLDHHRHHHSPPSSIITHRSSEPIGSAAIAFSAFGAEAPTPSPVHRRSCPNDIRQRPNNLPRQATPTCQVQVCTPDLTGRHLLTIVIKILPFFGSKRTRDSSSIISTNLSYIISTRSPVYLLPTPQPTRPSPLGFEDLRFEISVVLR